MTASISFFSVGLLLLLVPLSIHANTELCPNNNPCVLPQGNQTCPDFIAANKFIGTCCSLSNDTNTGGCTVTISDGHCFWEPRNYECDDGNCAPQGIQYLAKSTEACPASEFDPFVEDPTEAPVNAPPVTAAPAAATTTDPPVAGQPTTTTTDPPVAEPTGDTGSQPGGGPEATEAPVSAFLPTPNPVTNLPTGAPFTNPPTGAPFTNPPTRAPFTFKPTPSPSRAENVPTPDPTPRPTVGSLTDICGGADDGPCELIQKQPCPEFIAENNFVGSCCSLVHIEETGECIVRISDGHCFWEPADGSCDPTYGCQGEAGIFHTSLSDEPCPSSGFNVLQKGGGSVLKEERSGTLTKIWVSILLVLVVTRVIICFAKIRADRKNMEEDEDLDPTYGTSATGNNRPDLGWDAEGGMGNIDLQQQAQREVLNQHSEYFEEVLAGLKKDAAATIIKDSDGEVPAEGKEIT